MKRAENKGKKEKKKNENNLIVYADNLKDFTEAINKKKWCLVYFCGEKTCQEKIQTATKANSLCLPNKEDTNYEKKKCFKCGVTKTTMCLFA